VVTITWVKVPSYLERNNPTKFNTFQLRIVRETGNTIYAFIYGDMQWKVGYNNGKSFAGFGGDVRNGWWYTHTYTTFWTQSGSLSQLTNQTFWFNHSGVQIAAPAFVDPDIEVTQMASTYNPARRENFNITVTVTNLGPEPTTGVQITNELPSGLRFVSANTSQGSYDSSTGIWNIGNLEVNETVTLTLTVYAQQRGTYVIRSEKTSQVEYDPNSG
jgi:conserved repeat domain